MPKKKTPPPKLTKAPVAKPTKAQTDAAKRFDKFLASVKKALTVTPQGIRAIAAKLGMTDADGAVKPSDATKIRKAIGALIENGEAVREGSQRGTTYAKARKK